MGWATRDAGGLSRYWILSHQDWHKALQDHVWWFPQYTYAHMYIYNYIQHHSWRPVWGRLSNLHLYLQSVLGNNSCKNKHRFTHTYLGTQRHSEIPGTFPNEPVKWTCACCTSKMISSKLSCRSPNCCGPWLNCYRRVGITWCKKTQTSNEIAGLMQTNAFFLKLCLDMFGYLFSESFLGLVCGNTQTPSMVC